jgi:hypothetical protein
MIGSEEQNVPNCFTTLPAYARKFRTLNESALPIVPTGTTLSALMRQARQDPFAARLLHRSRFP